MDISFSNSKLEKECSDTKTLVRKYGPRCASLIAQRLNELRASATLDDMKFYPRARCHELTGNLKGSLAVDAEHPYRIIFEPDHNPPPTKPDGGLDWGQVTAVRIIDIMDYH